MASRRFLSSVLRSSVQRASSRLPLSNTNPRISPTTTSRGSPYEYILSRIAEYSTSAAAATPPPPPPRAVNAGNGGRITDECTNAGAVGQKHPQKRVAAKSVGKTISEYQYPWQEKLAKYRTELSKGVWGYWELGAWKPLGISARRRARLRKEVLLAGHDWPYDPERKEMRTKRKGHKCDRIALEKRQNTAKLMEKMPEMLLAYKKRRWEKKMKEEEKNKQQN